MPMPGYLTLTGQTQGKIDGSCTIQGHENTILVQAVDHTIEIPKSIQTGLPTGKRIHGPLTITKEIDKASPKLFQTRVLPQFATRQRRALLHRRNQKRHHHLDAQICTHVPRSGQ